MKLLFLDMDGVLNSHQSSHLYYKIHKGTFLNHFAELCPIACSNLDYLLELVPDLKIVLSSTWRIGYWDGYEKNMIPKVPSIEGRVIDRTPCHRETQRGNEIYEWLHDNGHLETPYVVLDDDSDMDKVRDRFIQTDARVGFSWINLEQVLKKFEIVSRI